MKALNVFSEIGPLKKVLLHRPGRELENLTPKWLEQLLFDDIPWLELARKEHDEFASKLRSLGVEVVYLTDLVVEVLKQSKDIKEQFIHQFIEESNITSDTLKEVVRDYLYSFKDLHHMVEMTMAGIRKREVPNFTKRTLTDYIKDYPFVTDPMPNLYFTRDPFSTIGCGVSISKMFTQVRGRETIYAEYIFKYHPLYKQDIPHYYDRNDLSTIEGGDVLILSNHVLAVGVSERTHPSAIEKLAKNLFYKYPTSFSTVLAFDIPKSRSFMHLDTVFTQVDIDKFLIHHEARKSIRAYELTKDENRPNKLRVKPIEDHLKVILETYLKREVTLIPCGGSDVISSDREQWNDGANTLCIKPGEVIVYERNHITNKLLQEHGVICHTIPSSELSRGRGGPRCMSMPLFRENIDV